VNRRVKNGKVYEYRVYVCATVDRGGRLACTRNRIAANAIESYVFACMKEDYGFGLGRADLRAALLEQLGAERKVSAPAADTKMLERKIAALETKIKGAVEKMLAEADAFIEGEMREAIARWRGDLAALQGERQRLLGASNAQSRAEALDVEAEADRILGRLDEIEKTFAHGPVAARNRVMKEYVNRVELFFWSEKKGSRVFNYLTRGVLETREVTNAVPTPSGGGTATGPETGTGGGSSEFTCLVGRGERDRGSADPHRPQVPSRLAEKTCGLAFVG
jgi:hypothetical protein